MAIMIKVDKRGTDTKGAVRNAAHFLNRKLKRFLYLSVILNIGLLTYIIIGK
jgi:hypothetical protein